MKPTLVGLAAGMGSRYGGLKQMDGLGPSGETIIDYSIYDAVEAGFGKVVYITILVINLNLLSGRVLVLNKELVVLSKALTEVGEWYVLAFGNSLTFPFSLKSVAFNEYALMSAVLSTSPKHAAQGNCGEEKNRFLK